MGNKCLNKKKKEEEVVYPLHNIEYMKPIPPPIITWEQIGGEPGVIEFDEDRLTKKCDLAEIKNYRLIWEDEADETDLRRFYKFVPLFYGDDCDESGGDEPRSCKLVI